VISSETIARKRLDARTRNLDGITYVAGPEQALQLSEVGGLIWRLVNGRRSVREIAESVSEQYSVDLEQASEDTIELLAQFADHQIIEIGSDRP
jgi:Coenzyme PQQ synthesis protein D (PqqD)